MTQKYIIYYSRDPDADIAGKQMICSRELIQENLTQLTPPRWAIAYTTENCGEDNVVSFLYDRRSTGGTSEYALVGVKPYRHRVELNAGPMERSGYTRIVETVFRDAKGQITTPSITPKVVEASPANDITFEPTHARTVGRDPAMVVFLDVASL